jgi:hypothetical protein
MLLAIVLAIIAPTVGIGMFAWSKIFDCLNKGYKKNIRDISLIVGLTIYISFLIVLSCGSKINPQATYKEYPIQYLTTDKVYFNNNNGYSLDDTVIIIGEQKTDYENIVVVETLNYEKQWIWKIPIEEKRYQVYLSIENYNKLQNKTIYKNK